MLNFLDQLVHYPLVHYFRWITSKRYRRNFKAVRRHWARLMDKAILGELEARDGDIH